MGFFDWFKRTPKTHAGNNFDDDDRKISAEIRNHNARAKKMRLEMQLAREQLEHRLEMEQMQAELDDLRESLADEDEEEEGGSDAIVGALLSGMLAGKANPPPEQKVAHMPSKRRYSDKEIRELLEAVPGNIRGLVKKLPDDALIARAQQYAPDADDDSLGRALLMIRSW